jgi:hypothetical protein
MPKPEYFSKSRLVSASICLKKAYLEKHQANLKEDSAQMEAAFAAGNAVGDKAKEIYGTLDAVEIPFQRPMSKMVNETKALIDGGHRAPIFEATFQHLGVLVRVDVLLPDGEGWRAVEIKASKEVKGVHHIDCAAQLWVMRGVGVAVNSIALGYVDGTFVYQGDGDYQGLIIEEDLTELATAMAPDVESLIERATEAVRGDRPDVPVGRHCEEPYDCGFADECWPTDTDYPVRHIGGTKAHIFEWVARGHEDIRDIPPAEISAERQQLIHRVTCAGAPQLLPGARQELEALGYPRYHLDFETTGPAIPIWQGSRSYQTHAVQWSVHIDDGTGDGSLESTEHREFLDLSGNPPMRPLAEALIDALGDEGPVFMWHHYERGVINGLIKLFPDLEPQLQLIIERLVDLKKVTERYYYHPDMMGSYSIKYVAPTVDPELDYAKLEGINEGNAAADGYMEAIHPDTTPERKAELEEQLLRYCRFDTKAMVEIAKFLSQVPN